MALNFSVSYSFAPSTTISSSQVNTNTSDVANVFIGLEAKTKSFSNLQVDATPTAATDVSIKSYVDKLNAYRHPNLQYNSATVVNAETGLDGTSGDLTIVFSDGTKRTDTATGRIQCNLAQVAALSGSWQSGLRTGTVATNTWYAIYAVKTTDDTAKMVLVADVVLCTQANYATLNSNFGTNGWVYLGLIRNGDQNGATNVILKFSQSGNVTLFRNVNGGNSVSSVGVLMATSASATTLTWTYAAGTAGAVLPNNIVFVQGSAAGSTASTFVHLSGAANQIYGRQQLTAGAALVTAWMPPNDNMVATLSGNAPCDVYVQGFSDGALGIGANPLL